MKLNRLSLGLAALLLSGNLNLAQGQSPQNILIMGDSIMQAVARSLERQISRQGGGVKANSYTHIGTGLARLDLFDWLAQIEQQVQTHQPDTVFIMMGANDNQPMQTSGGVVRPGDAAWEREYARRAGEAMDIMVRLGVRRIHWIELPDMREARLQNDVNTINRLVREEANKRQNVTFQESRSLLSRTPGEYSPYIIQANGMPLDIRAGDGIHLNRRGADFLAEQMIARTFGN